MEELGVIDVIITAHQHQTVVGKIMELYMFKQVKMLRN